MLSQRSINAGIKELDIFDHFRIDQNLPKHKNQDTSKNVYINTVINGQFDIGVTGNGSISINADLQSKQRLRNLYSRLYNLLNFKRYSNKQSVATISVQDFFNSLSSSYCTLTPTSEVAKYYENAIIKAMNMGQAALVEKLKDIMSVVRGECYLIEIGLTKYVTEKQIINFYESVKESKNLKLSWICNFTRNIPVEIYKAKMLADSKNIFDNYVVLHYDPDNTGQSLTKQELEKKKDPILFGVIQNSRKLYYIGDWKDEYCDLSLEDMFNTLGEDTPDITYETVKTFIDKK